VHVEEERGSGARGHGVTAGHGQDFRREQSMGFAMRGDDAGRDADPYG
jgi:hypothetical protein